MTCGVESHWNDYPAKCHSCRSEVRDWVKSGSITEEEQNQWLTGKLRIPLR